MERLYYVQNEHETSETSNRLEAARIAAEWIKRGYKVETIAVDVADGFVRLVDNLQETTEPARPKTACTS